MTEIIGSGLAFPLQVDRRGQIALANDEQDIEQAIQLILGTAPGERPMRPEFGCGVHDFVFDSIDANTIGSMEQAIRDALVRWEPRIEVQRVDFDSSDAMSGLLDDRHPLQGARHQHVAQPRLPVLRHPRGGDGVRLPEIQLDDRRFQDLVNEARTRIARSCPEWTEHNVSDPGITLIELFAWMTEMTIYRLNRVPDKLHVALLDLLGIRLGRPSAATTEPALPAGGRAERADPHPRRRDRGRHAAHRARRVDHLPDRRGLHDPVDDARGLRARSASGSAQERRRRRRRGAPAGLGPARLRHPAAGRRRALPRLRRRAGPAAHPDRRRLLAGPRRGREPGGPAAALGGLPGRQRVGAGDGPRGPHRRLQLRLGHGGAGAAPALARSPRSPASARTGCAAGSPS